MNDLHLQVGQLMIMGFEGPAISANVETLLDTIQPAGVVLFARNIVGADQVHRLLGDCQDLVQPTLFTCVDMEGGTVDRLRDVITPAPSAQEVFEPEARASIESMAASSVRSAAHSASTPTLPRCSTWAFPRPTK